MASTDVVVGPWLWTIEIDGAARYVVRANDPIKAAKVGIGLVEATHPGPAGIRVFGVLARPATSAERMQFANLADLGPAPAEGLTAAPLLTLEMARQIAPPGFPAMPPAVSSEAPGQLDMFAGVELGFMPRRRPNRRSSKREPPSFMPFLF